MKKIIIVLCCLLLLTGCYNYHELENLGITSSILVDYTTQYEVTVEIEEDDKTNTYSGSGETLSEALENTLLGTEKFLYYTHLNAVFITRNVNVMDVALYFIRNPDINNTFYFVITESTNIYQEDVDLGMKVIDILERNGAKNFFNITKILFDDNIDLIIPILNEDGKITSAMVYKGLDEAGILEFNDVENLNLLLKKTDSFIKSDCKGGYFVINTNKVNTKYNVDKNIQINIEIEASINESTCNLDTTEMKVIKELEDKMNATIHDNIDALLEYLRTKDSDILGINRMILNKNHNLDKTWLDYGYDIKINTHINKKGLILK